MKFMELIVSDERIELAKLFDADKLCRPASSAFISPKQKIFWKKNARKAYPSEIKKTLKNKPLRIYFSNT